MRSNRRSFLKMMGTTAAVGCAGRPTKNGVQSNTNAGATAGQSGGPNEEPSDGFDTGFLADTGELEPFENEDVLADPGYGLPDRVPSSLRTASLDDDDLRLSIVSGTMPSDITGHMWMVHPMPPGDDAALFAGNGRVVRLDLDPAGIDAKLRLIRTPCHYADLAAAGTSYAFQNMSLMRFSMQLGGRNMANTAFAVLDGDRVLVTYDGGRPHELNPATAEMATAVGEQREWVGTMPSWMDWFMNYPFKTVMSTAHPAVDGETLFTVEFNTEILGNGTWTRVCRWNGDGPMASWKLVDPFGRDVGIEQSVHQIAISEDFIVIVDTAFSVEIEDMLGGDATHTQLPDTVMWVVKRSDLSASRPEVTARRIQVPLEITHVYCDYANPDGVITLHVAHTPALDVSEFIEPGDRTVTAGFVRNDLIGLLTAPTDLGALGRIRIDGNAGVLLDRKVVRDELLWGGPGLCTHPPLDESGVHKSMFWVNLGMAQELRLHRLEEVYAAHPYRHVPMHELPTDNRPLTIVHVNPSGPEIVDSWVVPPGRFLLSPQWVPGGNAGYIVASMISDDRNTPGSSGCEIWIFDAENLAQGPITRLSHPDYNVAFTLHTAWTQTANERTAGYQVSVRDDLSDQVSNMNAEIRSMFESSVYPHFE